MGIGETVRMCGCSTVDAAGELRWEGLGSSNVAGVVRQERQDMAVVVDTGLSQMDLVGMSR